MVKRGKEIQAEVLRILREQNGALSAYNILEELQKDKPRLAPQTIYRALTALTEHGRVHRLESLNAFVACKCDHHKYASILSICNYCGVVEEHISPDLLNSLSQVARKTGFTPTRHIIELHGLCSACTDEHMLEREDITHHPLD